jgi:hemoglobin/transferrin/lactoferrin receptor protein
LAPSEKAKTFIYAKDENGNPYAPSWYTINTKATYTLGKFQYNLGWENITNQRYRPYSSGIVAAGSNIITSVRYSF